MRMKKRHEELTRAEFDAWLGDQFPGQHARWMEPPSQEPRPDWFLNINTTEYAVEATSIVPTVKEGRRTVLEFSISAAIGDFIDAIQEQAFAEGILHGAYAIGLGPMPNNRALRARVTSSVLDFIRSTKDQPTSDLVILDHVGDCDIIVQKLHMGLDYLAEYIDLGTKSEAEVTEDFRAQFAASIERKSSLYQGFSRPVVLLLLDGFHIVDTRVWLEAAHSVAATSTFAAVFRIKPANPPLLLAANSRDWPPSGWSIGPAA
jgi:hypothetical protein